DGIRDKLVTGVQTCALPIWPPFVGGRAYHLPTSRLRARVEVDNVQNLIPALCGVDNGTVRALGRVVKGDDHVTRRERTEPLAAATWRSGRDTSRRPPCAARPPPRGWPCRSRRRRRAARWAPRAAAARRRSAA